MQVAISAEIEAVIGRKIKSGRFSSPEEVIEAGVLLLDADADIDLEKRRADIVQSLERASIQISQGQGYTYNVDEFLERARNLRRVSSAD